MTVIRFSRYLRDLFGERVQRIPLHAGLTCPNRDGTKGIGGCIFCDNGSFHPGLANKGDIREQMEEGCDRAKQRYKAKKFLAYFQTFSNTYGSQEDLRRMYEMSIERDDVVGLMVATRPDCMSSHIIQTFIELSRVTLVWIEFGIQTCHDATLAAINRGHTVRETEETVARIRSQDVSGGVHLAGHVILGLPGETRSMMMETADWMASMGFEGVKLHHLHAVRGTKLASMYRLGSWKPMAVETYIENAAEFLTRLPDGVVVMRLVGDCPDNRLVAPRWTLAKGQIEQRIRESYTRLSGQEME